VAIKFGRGNDESVIVISTSHCSPLLVFDDADDDESSSSSLPLSSSSSSPSSSFTKDKGSSSDLLPFILKEEHDEKNMSSHHDPTLDHPPESRPSDEPLWSHSFYKDRISMPLSLLPSNLLIGTGGTATDAIALHRTILEIAMELYKEHDNFMSTHRIKGTVTASMLAKRIANHLQLPTQSAASAERMLASAALVVGSDHDLRGNRKKSHLSIWRCDPTGQFWDCSAAAVGRGAGMVEAEIMARVVDCLEKGTSEKADVEELVDMISPKDVGDYLEGISWDDAVILACQCIKKALGISNEKGDRIVQEFGVQGVFLHFRRKSGEIGVSHGDSNTAVICREAIYADVLSNAFDYTAMKKDQQ